MVQLVTVSVPPYVSAAHASSVVGNRAVGDGLGGAKVPEMPIPVLPLMVQLVTVSMALPKMPPSVLSLTVELVTVTVAALIAPPVYAELPLSGLKRSPFGADSPPPAELPLRVEFVTVSVPVLSMPPPVDCRVAAEGGVGDCQTGACVVDATAKSSATAAAKAFHHGRRSPGCQKMCCR